MSQSEAASLACALRLLEAGFTDYADAILRACIGPACVAALRLVERGQAPIAMTAIREALAENG